MIVVDVDDPGLGRDLLGDLVSVLGGGQACADVQELPGRLPGQSDKRDGLDDTKPAPLVCV